MSLSMILTEGLTAAIVGMGIVFGVLALLALVLSFFKYLNSESAAKPDSAPIAPISPPLDKEDSTTEESEDIVGDNELIAVISASIAAFMGSGSYKIKSVTPVKNASKPWNIAARRENQRGLY